MSTIGDNGSIGIGRIPLKKSNISKNFELAGQRNWVKRRLLGVSAQISNMYGSSRLTLEEREKLVKANSILKKIIDKYRLGYAEIYNNNK